MKPVNGDQQLTALRRAPRGARGLKLEQFVGEVYSGESRPARGAWIETAHASAVEIIGAVAPRAGRVD